MPLNAKTEVLLLCRRICGVCGLQHEAPPERCQACGRRWPRPSGPAGAEEAIAARLWRLRLEPLEASLPCGCTLARARVCFSNELHEGGLAELVDAVARTHARFFAASERNCYTLLALRTPTAVLGAVTDFPWRSRPSAAGFGEGSSDCLVFALAGAALSAHRCRRARGPVLRWSGGVLEVGPALGGRPLPGGGAAGDAGEAVGGAALTLGGLGTVVSSEESSLFGSPRLTDAREVAVSAVLCLSWAHLEAEAVEESLHALTPDQDSFMLNFIGSSVRGQLAAKAGSAWC